jgi:hypothetical protein
MALKQW